MNTLKVKSISIARKKIGYNEPCFIIAEAGVNHNGKLTTALRMADQASKAGADAIKFQTFKAGDVVSKSGKMAQYQKKNTKKHKSQLEMLRPLELKELFYEPIIKRCKKKNIMFLSTPHGGFESVDFLQKLGVGAFKFGSGDINNFPVLEYAAKFKKPMILGTGMSTIKEVKEAINCIKKAGNNKIIVLHCTTSYPCQENKVNLRAIKTMMQKLGVLVGYSDHTLGTQVPVMARTLGVCIIEKHFTLDKSAKGPDHKASLSPKELKKMIVNIRKTEIILGSSVKKPDKSEIPMIKIARKSIIAAKNIKKGDKLSKNNIAIKRPGTGLSPENYYKILGKIAKENIKADSLIKRSNLV